MAIVFLDRHYVYIALRLSLFLTPPTETEEATLLFVLFSYKS